MRLTPHPFPARRVAATAVIAGAGLSPPVAARRPPTQYAPAAPR